LFFSISLFTFVPVHEFFAILVIFILRLFFFVGINVYLEREKSKPRCLLYPVRLTLCCSHTNNFALKGNNKRKRELDKEHKELFSNTTTLLCTLQKSF